MYLLDTDILSNIAKRTPTFFWISWKRHYCPICRCFLSMGTQHVVTER